MNELEACKKWVKEFNQIHFSLLEKAYGPHYSDIEVLAPTLRGWAVHDGEDYADETFRDFREREYPYEKELMPEDDLARWEELFDEYFNLHRDQLEDAFFELEEASPVPMWSTIFVPSGMDQDWFRDNAEAVAGVGFIVYETDEIGVYIGVNGAGYDFYSQHWLPLYRLRGLRWHDEEK